MKHLLLISILLLTSCGINPRKEALPDPIPNMSQPDLTPISGKTNYFGYPRTPSKTSIMKIITAKDYDAMEALVLRYDILSRDDYRYEFHVKEILQTLSESKDALSFLNGWKFKLEESQYVDLAFARYYIDQGLEARGNGYINTVSKEDRNLLDENLTLARESLERVHEKDPTILYQWNSHLRIATVYGSKEYALQAINSALAINPYQYLIRLQFANHLRPRWGGNYAVMDVFSNRCDSLAQFNPRLLAIRAERYDDNARVFYSKKDTASAMAAYAKALEVNPIDRNMNWWVCKYYWEKKDFKKALQFSRNLVTLFPQEAAQKFYVSHAKLLFAYAKSARSSMSTAENNKLIEEMARYNEKALRISPGNAWAQKNKRWYSQFMRGGKVVK